MLIDSHAHWIPQELADLLRRREQPPCIRRTAAGERFVTLRTSRSFDTSLGDPDARRRRMNAQGIDLQVLSLSSLFGIDGLPVAQAVPLVSAFNRATLEAQRTFPESFAGLAALPLADAGMAAEVLQDACGAGLKGAILPASSFRDQAAASRLAPVLEAANRLRCHLFIHPSPRDMPGGNGLAGGNGPARRGLTGGAPPAEAEAWLRWQVLAAQSSLSEAMITLDATDLLDPYPHLTVQVANLGGTLAFLGDRIASICRDQHGSAGSPWRQAQTYVDTASFGPRSIALAEAYWGAGRILFGTDSPIFDAGAAARSLATSTLAAASLRKIECENALHLYMRIRPPARSDA